MAKFALMAVLAMLVSMVSLMGWSDEVSPIDKNSENGERSKRFVINGEDAVPHQFPWTVFLLLVRKASRPGVCSGSLISPRVVLTAAHCLRYPNRSLASTKDTDSVVVFPGRHRNPLKLINGEYKQYKRVVSKTFELPPLPKSHKNYSYYDYGVIILPKRLKRSKTVDFIPLANSRSPPPQTLRCYAAGFGNLGPLNITVLKKLSSNESELSRYRDKLTAAVLQKVRYKVVTMKRCYVMIKDFWMKMGHRTEEVADGIVRQRKRLAGWHFCGEPANVSSAVYFGDSGGPFMCRSRSGPWILYGSVSSGPGICVTMYSSEDDCVLKMPGPYAIFASVPAITNWLKKILAKYDTEGQVGTDTMSTTQAATWSVSSSDVELKIKGSRQETWNLSMDLGLNA